MENETPEQFDRRQFDEREAYEKAMAEAYDGLEEAANTSPVTCDGVPALRCSGCGDWGVSDPCCYCRHDVYEEMRDDY